MLAPSHLQDVEASSKHTVHTGGRSPACEDLLMEQERHGAHVPHASPNRYAAATPSVHDIPSLFFDDRCPLRPIPVFGPPGYYTLSAKIKSRKKRPSGTLFQWAFSSTFLLFSAPRQAGLQRSVRLGAVVRREAFPADLPVAHAQLVLDLGVDQIGRLSAELAGAAGRGIGA